MMIKNNFIPYYKRFINVFVKHDAIYYRILVIIISLLTTTSFFFDNLPIIYIVAILILHICLIFLVANSCCKNYITYIIQEDNNIVIEYYKYNSKKKMILEKEFARVHFGFGKGKVYDFRLYYFNGNVYKRGVVQECIEEWAKKENILELQKIFNSTVKLYT